MNCASNLCNQGRIQCPTPYQCAINTKGGGATIDDGMPVQMLDHEDEPEDAYAWFWFGARLALLALALLCSLMVAAGFYFNA